MIITVDEDSTTAIIRLMYQGQEVSTELDLAELEALRKEIDECLTKLGKRTVTDKQLYRQMQNLVNAAD